MATGLMAHVNCNELKMTRDFFSFTSPNLYLLFAVLVITLLLRIIKSYLSLRKIPGPFLAKFTSLWWAYQAYKGKSHLVLLKLHEEYGQYVRIGPNTVHAAKLHQSDDVWREWTKLNKSNFYEASYSRLGSEKIFNIFSQTNPHLHKEERKPIARLYSKAAINKLQPHINSSLDKLTEVMDKWFKDNNNVTKSCDLWDLISRLTWDSNGQVTFSSLFGYLEKGHDFDGTLDIANRTMTFFMIRGLVRWLDPILNNRWIRIGPPGFDNMAAISSKHLENRQGSDKASLGPRKTDFLQMFIKIQEENPHMVPDTRIISWLMVNTLAGADTTAFTIWSCIYFGHRNPKVWQRLTKDVLAHDISGQKNIRYEDIEALPYLVAVVSEALRLHPAVSMPLLRVVPEGGFNLKDCYLSPGTELGVNPFIVGQDESVFGNDVAEFRPERWLCSDDETDEVFNMRLKRMKRTDLSFGAGSRMCIGKHLGLLQTYMVIYALIKDYNINMASPEECDVINHWFSRPKKGILVNIAKRHI